MDDDELLYRAIETCDAAISLYGEYWRRIYKDAIIADSPRGDFASNVALESGVSENWDIDLESRLSLRAILYMSASREHLQGLRALLLGHPYGLTVAPAARSVMESAGRCTWLLDHKLKVSTHTRERVARLCIDEEDEARGRLNLLKKTHRQNDIRKAKKAHDEARSHLTRPGLFRSDEIELELQKDGSWKFVSLCKQSSSDLSALAYSSLFPNKKPEEKVDLGASLTYSYLSDMTHSKFTVILESMTSPRPGEEWLYRLREDNLFCARTASTAVTSFIHGWKLLARWLNKATAEGERLDAIHRVLNDEINIRTTLASP